MNFTGFYGNEMLKGQLERMFALDRVPHAIILEGASGLGKKTLAMLIAKAVVCIGGEERPCDSCPACIRAQSHNHPDIIVVEGSGKTGAISVATIRDVKEDAYIKPSEAKRKVYILPDSDKTLAAAQNAFLKILEEPPDSAMFIITCSSSLSLLETIRSRAVVLRLSELNERQCVEAVCTMTDADESQVTTAYSVCGGNIGMIKARLSDSTMSECMAMSAKIANAMLSPKQVELVIASAPLEKDRENLISVMNILSMTVRDAIMIKNGVKSAVSGDSETADMLAKKLTLVKLNRVYEVCGKIIDGCKRSVNMGLLVSEMCLSLRNAAGIN